MSRCAVEFTGGLTSHPPASPKRNEQIKRRELAQLRSGLGCKSTLGRGKVLEFLWVVKSFGHLPSRFSYTFGPVITFVFSWLCSVDSIGNTGGRQTSNSCFAAGCWLNHGGVRHSTGQKSWCLAWVVGFRQEWMFFRSQATTMMSKCTMLAKRCASLGLKHPTEVSETNRFSDLKATMDDMQRQSPMRTLASRVSEGSLKARIHNGKCHSAVHRCLAESGMAGASRRPQSPA